MRYAVDPRQEVLFDAAEAMFSPMTVALLRGDWPGLFRAQMLHLMPVRELGEHFHPNLGCPTKELHGMAGVIFLKEFFDLTIEQTVAEDLLELVSRFAEVDSVTKRSSYQAMKRVLEEQCELKDKTGGNVMQNPSDPDATYDGHKGPGHQVQIAETCGEDNDVQVITAVIPEPAHCPDQEAVEPVLDQLESNDRLPDTLYGDTHYGSDENVAAAAERGVDLQSPVSGTAPRDPDALTIDDFVIDEATETVERCPNGCEPLSSEHDAATGVTTTQMRSSDCQACEFASHCPVKSIRGRFVLKHTAKQRRLAARRAEQATQAFRDNYAIRSGGESVNSGLKRRMGMGRLRVRGSPRVRMAVLLRCAGWNVLRALSALKKRGIRGFAGAFAASWLQQATSWCGNGPQRVPGALITQASAYLPRLPHAAAA